LTNFTDLALPAPLLRALEDEGYTAPTPIQARAIPPVLAGRDLLGIAQTGTGKTAAFALPILARLAAEERRPARRTCRALVLAPTRELASQIAESFRTYGRHLRLSVAVVFGGVGHRPQIEALSRGVDILVATPGRLLDHMGEGAVSLAETRIFVLDEADQMLDLGFLPPIRRIVRTLPATRQNLFFSATMPPDIARLADDLLRDPERVAVARVGTAAERVAQRVVHVDQSRKSALLVELLADPGMTRTLVFARTKRRADRIAEHLERAGIGAAAIHGNKSQGQRERALEAFRDGSVRTLVATDIAARGIDIDEVTHVVNYDLPEVPDAYVHRIGRTARAGASGQAIAFCDREETGLLRAIERLTRQAIPSEDRRGDTSLAAVEARGRDRERGPRHRHTDRRERTGGPSRREADGNRERGMRRGGSDRRSARPDGERSERRERSEHQRPDARPARGPRPDRAPREMVGEPRSLTDVGFLAAPTKPPRGSGRTRRPHVGG
jgi:ATP-dependent RNA helicase RhlE